MRRPATWRVRIARSLGGLHRRLGALRTSGPALAHGERRLPVHALRRVRAHGLVNVDASLLPHGLIAQAARKGAERRCGVLHRSRTAVPGKERGPRHHRREMCRGLDGERTGRVEEQTGQLAQD